MNLRSASVGIGYGIRGGSNLILSVFGLSLGLTVCFLILVVARYETGFDGFLPDAGRTYRVEATMTAPGRDPTTAPSAMGPLRDALVADFPEITETSRFLTDTIIIERDGNLFEQTVYEAEPNFVSFFGLPVTSGSAADQGDISSALISADLANRLFGRDAVVGETLTFVDGRDFVVSGVFDNWPINSHMRPELVVPFNSVRYEGVPAFRSWLAPVLYTYIKLGSQADSSLISAGLDAFVDRRVDLSDRPGFAELTPSELLSFDLIEVGDIHLHSQAVFDLSTSGDADSIYSLLAVAALVLFVAIINFSLLFTAMSLKRTRSAALHMAVGANRKDIALMFLLGPIIPVSVAVTLALGLTNLALPYLNATGIASSSIDIGPVAEALPVLALFWLVATLGGGAIAAFFMSLLKPAEVLQTSHSRSRPIGVAQGILIFLQFAIVIGLTTVTIGIYRQNQFATDFDPGYTATGLSVLPVVEQDTLQTTIDELLNLPGISSAAWSSHVPGDGNQTFVSLRQPSNQDGGAQSLNMIAAGPGFFDILEIGISTGREFTTGRPGEAVGTTVEDGETPTGAALLNEAAARFFGYLNPASALGENFMVSRSNLAETNVTIIGVVSDFHLETIHRQVTPTIYLNWPEFFPAIIVKSEGADAATLDSMIAPLWQRLQAGQILSIRSLQDTLDASYSSERQMAGLFGGFVFLAVLLSSLGIYGVAALSTAARIREVAIRKVMGAGVAQILVLLTCQLSRPVLLANLLAWPLGWYFLDKWLEQFAYRVEASPLWLAVATAVALLVASGTVIIHAAKAALANPVRSLRHE